MVAATGTMASACTVPNHPAAVERVGDDFNLVIAVCAGETARIVGIGAETNWDHKTGPGKLLWRLDARSLDSPLEVVGPAVWSVKIGEPVEPLVETTPPDPLVFEARTYFDVDTTEPEYGRAVDRGTWDAIFNLAAVRPGHLVVQDLSLFAPEGAAKETTREGLYRSTC
jgi:hypothetical protein